MSLELKLTETKHPNSAAEFKYETLVGIDPIKNVLLDALELSLKPDFLNSWSKKHHPKGLSFLQKINFESPLIVLSGEVGCGKTALATSIGSILAKKIDSRVLTLETPTNLRGSGLVGEISKRITDAFEMARIALKNSSISQGILIFDEADDIATSRSQNQAHHEDRAGLNTLIKQIDRLKTDKINLAVILITNRLSVLDPAIRRRSSLEIEFDRPNDEQLYALFKRILEGTEHSEKDVKSLIKTAREKSVPFSFSDLVDRGAKLALMQCVREGRKFDVESLNEALRLLNPSPLLEG